MSVRLADYIAQTDFMLVETLAECCADLILTEFGARGCAPETSQADPLANAAAVGVRSSAGVFRRRGAGHRRVARDWCRAMVARFAREGCTQ